MLDQNATVEDKEKIEYKIEIIPQDNIEPDNNVTKPDISNIKYTRDEVMKASLEYFKGDELAANVFFKYALVDNEGNYKELTPDDMHKRLAKEFARTESRYPNPMSEKEVYELMKDFKYIVPQGSPMSALGNNFQIQSASNCFVEGTTVFTTNRGPVPIEEVLIGDETVTHKGNVKKVTQLHKNKLGDRKVFGIKCFRTPSFKVTDNHEFLSISREQLNWGFKPQFNSIKYLRAGDYIQIPNSSVEGEVYNFNLNDLFGEHFEYGDSKYKVTRDGSRIKLATITVNGKVQKHKHFLPSEIAVDEDFAYFLGLWYGDGCIFGENTKSRGIRNRKTKVCTKIFGITFTFGSHESKLVEFVTDYLNKKEIPFDINYNDTIDGTTQIVIHSPILGNAFEQWFGRRFDGKKLHKSIYKWPKNLVEKLVQGLVDSDGTITEEGDIRVVLSNKPLIQSFYHLLRSRSILVGYSEPKCRDGQAGIARLDFGRNNKIQSISNKSYRDDRVSSDLSESTQHCIVLDGNVFTEIIGKEIVNDLYDNVYTIGVEDDHSYSVEGLISLNCYVIDSCLDSYGGILKTDQEQVQLSKRRAGVGHDLSNIRPRGMATNNSAKTTDGIGIFMDRFSNSCREVAQNGRRGALMLSLDIRHPECVTFINIKKDKTKVTGANISLRLTDDFMRAVKENRTYEQRWPVDAKDPLIKKDVNAKEIWDMIIDSAWGSAEPGLLFWDTALKNTPSDIYSEEGFKSISTNPCGEIILSGGDSCRLLVLNLVSFVDHPFTEKAKFNYKKFDEYVIKAERLMDDLIDLELEQIDKIIKKVKSDPEPEEVKITELNLWLKIKDVCAKGRRTGLGVTSLGDCLAALGVIYGSDESIVVTEKIYKHMQVNAYKSTIILAKERGCFPVFDYNKEKNHAFVKKIIENLDDEYIEMYKKYGRRNIALTTTAPTGSVSVMTQTTSGIEPAFLLHYTRRKKINPDNRNVKVDFVDDMGDRWQEFEVYHHKYKEWMDITNKTKVEDSPYYKATSNDVDWIASVKIQAAAQRWICHSISKTCNLPNSATKELVADVYMKAWEEGCKGFTVYRDGCRSGVLVSTEAKDTFTDISAPKRPKKLPCDINQVNIKGEKWTIFIGKFENRPYEIFGGLSKFVEIPKKYKTGFIQKDGKKPNGTSAYDLIYGETDEETLIHDLISVFDNPVEGSFTRTLSLSLRHGIPIHYLVEQLQKDDRDSDMYSFSRVIARVLKYYIKEGIKASDKICENCKAENSIIYKEGCKTCVSCGSSRCG